MVEVDSATLEERLDFFERNALAVDSVLALIILESGSGDNQLRVRNDFVCVRPRLCPDIESARLRTMHRTGSVPSQ